MQLVLLVPDTAMASSSAQRRSALSAYGSSRRFLSLALSLSLSLSSFLSLSSTFLSLSLSLSLDSPMHVSSYLLMCPHMCPETSIGRSWRPGAAASVVRVAVSVALSVALSVAASGVSVAVTVAVGVAASVVRVAPSVAVTVAVSADTSIRRSGCCPTATRTTRRMLVSVAALTATVTATQLELPDCNTYYTPYASISSSTHCNSYCNTAGAAGLQHVLHAAEVGQCRARLC